MENRRNLLVTLSDRSYIQQAKQLFSSVYWNAGWEGDYMLLSHEVPEEELKWFSEKGILVKECKLLLEQAWGKRNELPPVIADKFYMFTEEFKKWKNIVYLDSDIIVRGPIEKLTKIKYFGAIQDIHFNRLSSQFHNLKKFQLNNKTFGLNVLAFNGGVLTFNTNIITPMLFCELTTILKEYINDFIFGEQTALNLYFYKKWSKLPSIYNCFINYFDQKSLRYCKCIILHFARNNDSVPPWEIENSFYQEWKINLEKAELIDLSKIQKVKKWNILSIKFYSTLLNIRMIIDDLKNSLFRHKLESFFRYRLKYFFIMNFLYIRGTPGRLLGKTGAFIKKYNPDLYYKLKKPGKK